MLKFKMSAPNKLSANFYNRNVRTVAKSLLGKMFVRNLDGHILSGRIVEVEAYDGKLDEASHSFIGITKRNEVMFGKAGNLYVYFTYGMHFCVNVVTEKEGCGAAVLIRAIEPIDGISVMSMNRFNKSSLSPKEISNLCNGPAKICKAFAINREQNGVNLCGKDIYVLDAPSIPTNMIVASTRIGIKKSIDLPWRYYIKSNLFISRI